MNVVGGVLLLSGFYPLYRAWRLCRGLTLRHALGWAAAAWGCCCLGAFSGSPALRYLALCLTACAGVAVLGARRPGAGAWHFVVGGLLAVLLLPLWLGLGEVKLQTEHLVILTAALAVGLGNYLPTRLAAAALLVAVWCVVEVLGLTGRVVSGWAGAPLAAALWLALLLDRTRGEVSTFDREWLLFRDRFGFVWAQRVGEQFNAAARHAGLPAEVRWSGLGSSGQVDEGRALGLLQALLRRFDAEKALTGE